jgi:hypothetical protein
MITLVHYLNASCTRVFDVLLWPVHSLSLAWGMTWISLLAGAMMLWIFGLTSNQKAIARVKDRIAGNLIGVQLFQHDLGVLMRLQGRILFDTLKYMAHSLIPLLVMLLPVLLILAQLNMRYATRPLRIGESALVKAKVHEALPMTAIQDKVRLEAGDGIVVETPPVRIPSEHEICWRIRAVKDGAYQLNIQTRPASASPSPPLVSKNIEVGSSRRPAVSLRTGRDFLDLFLYPGEPPIPADVAIESVEVVYPEARLDFFGWQVHWLVAFFVLSIVFGFAFKPILRVQI